LQFVQLPPGKRLPSSSTEETVPLLQFLHEPPGNKLPSFSAGQSGQSGVAATELYAPSINPKANTPQIIFFKILFADIYLFS
jgi:hypothetical protein